MGNLGVALAKYRNFHKYGLEIKALFDNDPLKIDVYIDDKKVHHLADLGKFVDRGKTQIAILAVPATVAQKVANMLVKAGIKAIWNFTNVNLTLPDNIYVWNEDLASSYVTFSQIISNKSPEEFRV